MRGARNKSGRGKSVSANVDLSRERQLVKFHIVILMALHVEKCDRKRKC